MECATLDLIYMYYTSGCVLVITEYMHISTDRPQYDTIGHQESSLSLKHGLCFGLFKLSTHSTTKDKARPLHLSFGAQCQAAVIYEVYGVG